MRTIAGLTIALLFYSQIAAEPRGQTQTQKEAGAITGTVKRDGKPASGITVIATPSGDSSNAIEELLNQSALIKATTDSAGVYRLEGLSPGKYFVRPSAAPLISTDGNSPIDVTVDGGSTVEDINFSLSLGGVITGRITDSDGNPVIGQRVSIKSLDEKHAPSGVEAAAMMGDRMYATDDRGIYRVFGLRPGRYIVSGGKDSDFMNTFFSQGPKRVQTFYPGVTIESKATPVQVTAGSEATGIDIQFSNSEKGFLVAGRVVDGEKGTPIPNAMVAYSKAQKSSDTDLDVHVGDTQVVVESSGVPGGFTVTNEKGEYRFSAVSPGNYKLEARSIGAFSGGGASQFYADPVNFAVKSSNLDKLDIKVHRGASIIGVVSVESTDPQDSLERFGRIMLMAMVFDPEKSYSSSNCEVSGDGSFRLGGLKPGKATLRPVAMSARGPGLLRVERNGVEVKELEIHPDEEITGIRVIIAPSTCVIRGRVTIQGGSLQPGATIRVTARPSSSADSDNPADFLGRRQAEVSGNGSFVFENLTPGTYDVEAFTVIPNEQRPRTPSVKQTVTVTVERPGEIELILQIGKTADK
jgi:protocatechuate 3,4-dioxygenase beta subunit